MFNGMEVDEPWHTTINSSVEDAIHERTKERSGFLKKELRRDKFFRNLLFLDQVRIKRARQI